MSLAAATREAVQAEPFLYEALRADVLNYTAAARYLDLGDEEAVAAALRRYRADIPSTDDDCTGDVRVTLRSGLGVVEGPDALLVVGDTALGGDNGDYTGVQGTGDVGPAELGAVLRRLEIQQIDVAAAGVCAGTLLLAVDSRHGASVLRIVEDTC